MFSFRFLVVEKKEKLVKKKCNAKGQQVVKYKGITQGKQESRKKQQNEQNKVRTSWYKILNGGPELLDISCTGTGNPNPPPILCCANSCCCS